MGRNRIRPYTCVYPEERIETELNRAVNARGGCTYKFTSPGRRGVPDRIVIMPKHGSMTVTFVELKAPGEWLRADQEDEVERMRGFGANVFVINSFSAIAEYFALLAKFRESDE